MKKKEKRRIMLLVVIIVIFIIILVTVKNNRNNEENEIENQTKEYVKILEDGTKQNVSKELNQNKEIEGIQISNIRLTEQLGQTILLAEVNNLTEAEKETIGIRIILLDKEQKEIGQMLGVIPSLKQGETKQLNIGITEDYVNAYNFKIEKQ